jgi:hypothetical protein
MFLKKKLCRSFKNFDVTCKFSLWSF